MNRKIIIMLLLTTIIFALGCGEVAEQKTNNVAKELPSFAQEKKAIIATLNNETKAAFQRDYEGWKEKWVQDSTISKTYINFSENSFSESIGWKEVSSFVKKYIEEHPEPEPLPKLLEDVEVRLYGSGAWVTYEQQSTGGGTKRETRLMEKVNGEWRIAGMHTTIYGFNKTK